MKNKQSQLKRVKAKMIRDGFITRNECINLPYNKITRLSHYILLLRKEGMEITTEEKDSDTIYTLLKQNKVIQEMEIIGRIAYVTEKMV